MRAARLTRKITIQSPIEVQNSHGEPIATYPTYAIRSAQIESLQGKESFNSVQEVNTYKVIFKIRYDSVTKSITEKMRVSYNSKIYDIESVVNHLELNREIHIHGTDRRS